MDKRRERLIAKFHEQIGFIQRSCDAFDKGAEDEAIRLGTSLRILFHDTQMSVSLIRHLHLEKKKILTSSRGLGDYKDYLSFKIDLSSSQPVMMLPLLRDKFRETSIENWWKLEPVFVHNGQNYSRRKIVLIAANKDGGAHVDEELDQFYEALCSGEFGLGITGDLEYEGQPPFTQGKAQWAPNAHLALMRQFAHETLTAVKHFTWLR